jgi:DNA modification methylase
VTEPYYSYAGIEIYHGDALACLRELPTDSVHCCVTSPPYWGLRDYGIEPSVWGGEADCEHEWGDASWRPSRWGAHDDETPGEKQGTNGGSLGHRGSVKDQSVCVKCGAWLGCFGLEPTPDLYIEHAVTIFREVRRVLRTDGTLWLNIGDSYASSPPGCGKDGVSRFSTLHGVISDAYRDTLRSSVGQKMNTVVGKLKPKDLAGIPWMLAFALRADGWYLRQDIVWSKPNPMPESVTDRCTRAHEYLFLLTKSARYYYDAEAIKEAVVESQVGRVRVDDPVGGKSDAERGQHSPGAGYTTPAGKWATETAQASGRRMTENVARARANGSGHEDMFGATRNRRSVWEIATQPFPEAHLRKVRSPAGWKTGAGSHGSIHEDGREREVSYAEIDSAKRNKRSVWEIATQPFPEAHFATFPEELVKPCILAGCPAGGTVLDPFGGSMTTMKVARDLNCKGVAIELNAEYIEIGKRRLAQDVLDFQAVV